MKRDDVTGVSHMGIDQTSAFKANLINDFNFVRVHTASSIFPRLEPGVGINIPPISRSTLRPIRFRI